MTIGEALALGGQKLGDAGIEEAQDEVRILLSDLTGIGQLDFFLKKNEPLPANLEKRYLSALEKRERRIPLQAVLGHAAFFGLDFEVSGDTLIPRADTEVLCEQAVKILGSGDRILDLCTGTGCILLSLLHAVQGTTGTGTDISEGAVALARRNAERLGLSARAEFYSGDLFEALQKEFPDRLADRSDTEAAKLSGIGAVSIAKQKFDLIISNPPYIPTADLAELMPEVRDFEPAAALDGGADGLDFYRRIIERAPDYLNPGGTLLFEIGYDEGEQVSLLLQKKGFSHIILKKDYGGNDRVCGGCLPESP